MSAELATHETTNQKWGIAVPYIETHRTVIAPSDCDHLGHMNVSRYFAAVSDGMFTLQTALGLTPQDVREGRRLSFAVVHAESEFKSEVAAGEAVFLESGVRELGTKSAVFQHRLMRLEDTGLVFETNFRCALLDLGTRRAVEIPDDVRAKAEAYMV